jgi:nicotinamidase-related amidase
MLVMVDVQGKLAETMPQKEELYSNLERVINCTRIMKIPAIYTEQTPDKTGPTLLQFSRLVSSPPIVKSSFSCYGERRFIEALEASERKQVLLVGLETHVCIYQTALHLLRHDYEVYVLADAVASRNPENKAIALQRMREEGAKIVSTEMALFELLKDAHDPHFKEVLNFVK